jgi:hypothetical protein
MRRFQDPSGLDWDVVVGRESWGAFFAIFVPASGTAAVRQTQLDAGSWAEAERTLDALDPGGLQALLARATIKSLE